MVIYLADLTHALVTISIDAFPLGVGYLASYVLAHSGIKPTIKIFRFYEDLMKAVQERPPDILAVTNYVWNFYLSRQVLRRTRELNPEFLAVMGGPNIPISADKQLNFMMSVPEADVYIIGEGERTFRDVVCKFSESGRRREKVLNNPPPNCLVRLPNGTVTGDTGLHTERIKDLDEIPSPYQAGLLDRFFGAKLYPMIETNRGCPFSCTFCHEGLSYYSKINRFSLNRVMADLDYIAERSQPSDTLFIADSNFGMYKEDMEIAAFIGELQRKKGWPQYINCTTGKNNPGAVIRAVDLLGGAMLISNSVQSMDSDVLKNIKRSNIKMSAYREIQASIKERGLKSMADMILCLPGESLATHFRGVRDLLDSGVQRILPYQLMLLEGTELNTVETRKSYQFETRFRVVPRNFGFYGDEVVFESEEIVIATSTLPFKDYLECRRLHLLLEIYLKEEPFRELFALAQSLGLNKSEVMFTLFDSVDKMPADIRKLFDGYVADTQGELFQSREELEHYVKAHTDDIMSGKFGMNLIQKYAVTAWFVHIASVINFLEQTIVSLAGKVLPDESDMKDFQEKIAAVSNYLKSSYIDIFDPASLQQVMRVSLVYDVAEWIRDGYKQPLENYRFSVTDAHGGLGRCSRDFVLRVSDDRRRYIQDKVSTFGTSKAAVGKMLTRMWLSDLRRDVCEVAEA